MCIDLSTRFLFFFQDEAIESVSIVDGPVVIAAALNCVVVVSNSNGSTRDLSCVFHDFAGRTLFETHEKRGCRILCAGIVHKKKIVIFSTEDLISSLRVPDFNVDGTVAETRVAEIPKMMSFRGNQPTAACC